MTVLSDMASVVVPDKQVHIKCMACTRVHPGYFKGGFKVKL